MSVERITIAAGPRPVQQAMEARGYTNVRLSALDLTCTAPDGSPRNLSLGRSLERWRLGQETLNHPFILIIDHNRLRADAVAQTAEKP